MSNPLNRGTSRVSHSSWSAGTGAGSVRRGFRECRAGGVGLDVADFLGSGAVAAEDGEAAGGDPLGGPLGEGDRVLARGAGADELRGDALDHVVDEVEARADGG